MKKVLLAGLSMVAMASAANAQEAPEAAVASPFAGPYVGIQAGVGQIDDLSDDLNYWYDNINNLRTSDRGGLVGLRVGYDYQAGNALVGVLAEGSFGKLNSFGEASSGGDDDPDHYKIGTRTKQLGSIRAKLGATSGRVAAYATGGFAFSNGKVKMRETDGSDELFDGKADRRGYVLGMGLAYALSGNSNIGLDYSHYEFGRTRSQLLEDDGTPTGYIFRQDYKVRTLMLSFNYGFGNSGGALPAVDTSTAFGGPYVGVQTSLGQLEQHYTDLDYWYTNTSQSSSRDRGVLVGLRGGYDFRVGGDFLAGVLAEVSYGKTDNMHEHSADRTDPKYRIGTRMSWLGSVRGKLGVASGDLSIFGTGGLAFSNAKHRFRETDGSDEMFDGKADRTGYVLGLGAAYAMSGRTTIGLDYSHYEFGSDVNEILEDDGDSTDYFMKQDYKVRSLTLSFNYRF
jgi:outer membrane immunogenic protein